MEVCAGVTRVERYRRMFKASSTDLVTRPVNPATLVRLHGLLRWTALILWAGGCLMSFLLSVFVSWYNCPPLSSMTSKSGQIRLAVHGKTKFSTPIAKPDSEVEAARRLEQVTDRLRTSLSFGWGTQTSNPTRWSDHCLVMFSSSICVLVQKQIVILTMHICILRRSPVIGIIANWWYELQVWACIQGALSYCIQGEYIGFQF